MDTHMNGLLICKTLFSKLILRHWIILEKHTKFCTCSYCKKCTDWKATFFGIWLPDKLSNGWKVLHISTKIGNYYLRVW